MPREKNPESTVEKKRAPRRRAAAPAPAPVVEAQAPSTALIARAAYFRALNRGFEPGHEIGDWLAAEAEVDAELLRGTAAS